MRLFLTVFLISITQISFSQKIEELVHELSFYKSGETWGNKKNIAYEILRRDRLNTKAINYLVEVYGRNGPQDSIGILFNEIIRCNPNSPIPYIIRATDRNARFERITTTQQIDYLKKAHLLDSTNEEAIYQLGKLYYKLFMKVFNDNKDEPYLDYYSKCSIHYFLILCERDEGMKGTLKYPLIQLANYQKDNSKIKLFESYESSSSYFPVSSFISLPNNWKTNYLVNVLEGIVNDNKKEFNEDFFKYIGVEAAVFKTNWYSKYLLAFDEPVLCDSLPMKVFRFTYIRSFDPAVVLRIENKDDTITIYWKIVNNENGNKSEMNIERQSKKLSISDWKSLENKLKKINFWNLPTQGEDIIGTDGSQWVLEGKIGKEYHVVDRWCGGKITSVCKAMIELTDLKIKEKEIY